MNEKLKKLALDAGIRFVLWDDSGRPMIANYTPEERLAEFAELIVAECLAVCAVNTDDEPLDYKRGVIFAMNRCQQNIKEHFGVEE